MSKTFQLDIVTPEKILHSEEVESLVAPAFDGMLGVLRGRAPLLCVLKAGEVKVRRNGKDHWYLQTGGFMEVLPDRTSLLVESAEDVATIDVPRAEQARDRAQARIARAEAGVDKRRAKASLDRAEARLRAARRR